jgi:hypothetical protein
MLDQTRASPYDGVQAFPDDAPQAWTGTRKLQVVLTGFIAAVPLPPARGCGTPWRSPVR